MDDSLEDLIVKGMIEKDTCATVVKCLNEKRYTDAINAVWPKLLKDKGNPYLTILLGIAYCHAEKNEDAELYLTRALEAIPNNFLARYTLARVFVQKKDYVSALEQLNELLSRGYEDDRVYSGIAALTDHFDR